MPGEQKPFGEVFATITHAATENVFIVILAIVIMLLALYGVYCLYYNAIVPMFSAPAGKTEGYIDPLRNSLRVNVGGYNVSPSVETLRNPVVRENLVDMSLGETVTPAKAVDDAYKYLLSNTE